MGVECESGRRVPTELLLANASASRPKKVHQEPKTVHGVQLQPVKCSRPVHGLCSAQQDKILNCTKSPVVAEQ
jgi:hypothetical protein